MKLTNCTNFKLCPTNFFPFENPNENPANFFSSAAWKLFRAIIYARQGFRPPTLLTRALFAPDDTNQELARMSKLTREQLE